MIAPLKGQLASSLIEAARTGISKLDKNSPLARELDGLNVDEILRDDVHKICGVMSFAEVVNIMSLVVAIKLGQPDTKRLNRNIKGIAKAIVERAEKKHGSLRTPQSCRDLLFDL